MRNQSKVEEAKRDLLAKAAKFHDLFNTPNGKEILAALEHEFEPTAIFSDNPHRTSYNAGRRDVVQYIKEMMRVHDEHTNTTI